MALANQEQKQLQAYFRKRAEGLSERVLDTLEDLFSEESIKRHREFEDRIQGQLRKGAKFIRRRRDPR